ncbi:hypothetical protein C8R43DRAFT_1130311 [Mycena crocata]|nr:hypothetical protein C8R43DRAFT_1130311 [Mycena crocata]
MPRERKPRKRVPRSQRQNLRMWAEGSREEVLRPHLEQYSVARDSGWIAERAYLQKVCNEFHARVDWRTPDTEEPVLRPFDPSAAIEPEILTDDEEDEQRARMEVLNRRIRRWFIYRIRRRRRQVAGLDPRKDPYAVILAKLSGLAPPPKARQAYQQYMAKSYAEKIAPVVAERWAEAHENNDAETVGRKEPKAGYRASIARKLYAALPADEKETIAGRAKVEAASAKAAYEKALKDPPPNTPAERQRCIDALPDFMAPILRGIKEYTGLKSVFIAGGPMPKFSGELRTVHVAYGRNRTAARDHFPQWDRERFSRNVLKFFVEYLHTAYTATECTDAALTSLSQAAYTIKPDNSDLDSADDDSAEESDSDDASDSSNLAPRKKSKKGTAGKPKQDEGKKSAAKRKRTAGTDKRTAATEKSPPVASTPTTATTSATTVTTTATISPTTTPTSANVSTSTAASTSATANAASPNMQTPNSPAEPQPPSRPRPRPHPPRPTVTTMEVPGLGEVTFADPTAGIAYNNLSYDQQRARNVLRNAAAGILIRDGFTPTTEPPASSQPRSGTYLGEEEEADGDGYQNEGEDEDEDDEEERDMDVDEEDKDMDVDGHEGALSDSSGREPGPSESDADLLGDGEDDTMSTPPDDPSTISDHDDMLPPAADSESTVPVCPAKAPEWVQHALTQVTQPDLGAYFNAAVAAWLRLEKACGFKSPSHRLSTDHRPTEIQKWIKTESARGDRPNQLREEMVDVWEVGGAYGEWDNALLHWGPNGLLSVLAGLHFWGVALLDSTDGLRDDWEGAVNDVSWILEDLASFHEQFKGRR